MLTGQQSRPSLDGATRMLPPLAYLEDKLSVHSRNILPALAERFRIVLITTDAHVPSAEYEDVIQLPSKPYELQCGFQFARVTERLFRRNRIAFAYTYNCSGFALRRVPYLHVFGGSFLRNWLEYYRLTPWRRRARLLPALGHYVLPEVITAQRARIVVAKTGVLQDDLKALYRRRDEIPLIHNGISREYLHLYEKKDFSRPPRVIFTGRLHMDKGILPIVQSFVRHPEIRTPFTIIGDGPDRAVLERLAAGDGRIQLLGWRSAAEIRTLLMESQIFLFPGIIGGYSCSLLEGMASGHACICYDLAGNREAVRDAGFYAPLNDAEAVWRRVAQLSADPECLQEYARRAHQRAKGLTWDAFATALGSVFLRMYAELGFASPAVATAEVQR